MAGKSFDRLASNSATTKRASISSGKRSTPSENVTGIYVTPLDPVSPELRERLGLETPHELLQCFIAGTEDIEEGDVLVVDDTDYPIKAVADWAAAGSAPAYKRLILEALKR